MRITEATDRAVTILFTGEDAPDRAGILALVRGILAERGLPPWEETEAECFGGEQDTLVIARPGRPRPMAFFFPEPQALLAGISGCRPGRAALYAEGTGYRLVLSRDMVCPSLWEFGRGRDLSPDWELHGREQGLLLAEAVEPGDLRRYFSTRRL